MVRTTGSKSFTPSETSVLLDLVEKVRPLHRERWDDLAAAYNDHIAGKDLVPRDADALKRRFMVLAYNKKTTSDEWREYVTRAMQLHQEILAENGASIINIENYLPGGLVRGEGDEMLLLNEGEAELVNSTSVDPDDFHMGRCFTSGNTTTIVTPVRTGKRGRPPGSTTGASAKRLAQQMQQVQKLVNMVNELEDHLREVRDALATVVETQANQSAVLAVLQQQLHQQDSSLASKFSTMLAEQVAAVQQEDEEYQSNQLA